jgi:hypothetical protein
MPRSDQVRDRLADSPPRHLGAVLVGTGLGFHLRQTRSYPRPASLGCCGFGCVAAALHPWQVKMFNRHMWNLTHAKRPITCLPTTMHYRQADRETHEPHCHAWRMARKREVARSEVGALVGFMVLNVAWCGERIRQGLDR